MTNLSRRFCISDQAGSAHSMRIAAACIIVAASSIMPLPSLAQIKPAPPTTDAKPSEEAPQVRPDSKPETNKPEATQPKSDKPDALKREGSMTLTRMNEIIRRLDPKTTAARPGAWRFTISERPVMIVTDILANRMRIVSPITKVEGLPEGALQRMMQANFDTALDARYAIARGVVWATFIHPLSELHDRQFISAIGQTVNLSLTFGKTFSSGAMSFGGGDSRDIIRKKLIEQLQKKGLPI